jgi:diaminohydroxyphosphoribosylaminopyrimidine deaminase/5-amino-6-(5-phosphoribosylamino)uracil reductase
MGHSDNVFMQRALVLARQGLYTTDPNPRVGCVIVKDDKIIGEGWHKRAGEPHAEILALQQAGSQAKGATVYVTLEPCCHMGKTPPCSDALINAGVTRVIAAMEDPNPVVTDKGLEKLREKGIDTDCGVLREESRKLNPGFIKRMESGLPFVRVKMAMSLDGRTAMRSGESQWITGEAARKDVQKLRARSSSILTGINTVLEDNPSLNVRLSQRELGIDGPVRQPMRVVLDSHLRFPDDASMCDLEHGGEVLIITTEDITDDIAKVDNIKGRVVKVPGKNDQVNLHDALKLLADEEQNEVHVEAGAVLCGALVQQKFVDEIVIYMAPHLMGDDARGLFSLPGLSKMKDRISLDILDVRSVGKDLRIDARPVYK